VSCRNNSIAAKNFCGRDFLFSTSKLLTFNKDNIIRAKILCVIFLSIFEFYRQKFQLAYAVARSGRKRQISIRLPVAYLNSFIHFELLSFKSYNNSFSCKVIRIKFIGVMEVLNSFEEQFSIVK